MNYIILAIGIGLLIYDGILASRDKTTISQWCQSLFPPGIDWCIAVSGWVGLCVLKYFVPEFDFSLAIFYAGFWGHIWIPTRERYKKD